MLAICVHFGCSPSGRQSSAGSPPDHIEILFSTGINLYQGTEIRCKGKKAGEIISVASKEADGHGRAKAIIQAPYFPLKQGDSLILRHSGLLGDSYIELVQNSDLNAEQQMEAVRLSREPENSGLPQNKVPLDPIKEALDIAGRLNRLSEANRLEASMAIRRVLEEAAANQEEAEKMRIELK
jgi:ABC-type transporter Mla subunit MlaD